MLFICKIIVNEKGQYEFALPLAFPTFQHEFQSILFSIYRNEVQKLLQDHHLTESYTLELLETAIGIAKEKIDVSNLMRAVENLQDLHGMNDKNVVKTVDKLEASSASRLIDELREEEKHLVATRTTTKEVQDDDKTLEDKEGQDSRET